MKFDNHWYKPAITTTNSGSLGKINTYKKEYQRKYEYGTFATRAVQFRRLLLRIFKDLDARSKLDLISRLSQSIKETELIAETSLQSLFGAYPSEESADDIIEEIRSSRVFEGNTELL